MSRRYLRPGVWAGHLLVLIAALVCLRLGWWQWNVAHETRGTIQNLGYALLWPVFGGAFIFMWLRFLYLEGERRTQQAEPEGTSAPIADSAAEFAADPAAVTVVGSAGAGPSDTGPQPVAEAEPADSSESDGQSGEQSEIEPDERRGGSPRNRRPSAPTTSVTIAVATVGDDDEDDPELAAYNEALARLAEQDRRRAR